MAADGGAWYDVPEGERIWHLESGWRPAAAGPGLTQEEFAAQLNVSRQAVSKWESCRGYPELEKILYICSRYGVTLDELFRTSCPGGPREVRPEPPARMAPSR